MTETYADKPLLELTGGELEIILTRALCVAANYGELRKQMELHKSGGSAGGSLAYDECEQIKAFYHGFLQPSHDRISLNRDSTTDQPPVPHPTRDL